MNPEKVSAVAEMPRPADLKEVRRFTGMASWYRRFVKDFASIISPLHALTKKDAKFVWREECERAFVEIRERLMSAPVLTTPDFPKDFDLYCDASRGIGLGAVLSQEGRVIAYASRSLTKHERKYFPIELECLAVLWAIEKFRGYLEGYRYKTTSVLVAAP